MPRNPRRYDLEAAYDASPARKKARAQRNRARLIVKKKLGAAAIAGKDVDHKTPIRSGGGNSPSNLRVSSPSKNRSANGHTKKRK